MGKKANIYSEALVKKYFFFMVSLILISTLFAIVTYRFLYLDGSYFFDSLLFKQGFNTFDHPREYAQYITQVPTLLAYNFFEIENKNLLMYIYGATLYGIPILSIILSYLFLENKQLIFIPLASFFLSSIYTYSFIISEAHVMASFFWLSLILLLRTKLNVLLKIFTILLLLASTRLYESYMLLSVLLGISVVYQIVISNSLKERLYWIFSLTIIVYGFSVALESYMYPRDPANAGQFARSITSLLDSSNFKIIFALFIITFLVYRKSINLLIPIIMSTIVLVTVMLYPTYMEINMAYAGRTLLVIFPFIFGFIFIVISIFWDRLSLFYNILSMRLANATLLIAALFVGLQLAISLNWHQYIQLFYTALQNNQDKTMVDYRQTVLNGKTPENKIAREFYLRWTYPFVSYALSEEPILNVIIYERNHRCLPEPYSSTPTMKPGQIIYNNTNQKIYDNMITKIKLGELVNSDSIKVLFLNWGEIKDNYRWNKSTASSIKFHLSHISASKGLLTLDMTTLELQEIKIVLNNHLVDSQIVDSDSATISFFFDPKILNYQEINTIYFNGKNSVLGLKSFKIE